eukprot:gene19648-biopygen10053
MILHASAWGKRQRTRTGRGPDAGRTLEFEQTDADRTRAWPFLPEGSVRNRGNTEREWGIAKGMQKTRCTLKL